MRLEELKLEIPASKNTRPWICSRNSRTSLRVTTPLADQHRPNNDNDALGEILGELLELCPR
eukprot:3691343-Lingulodinium_polyedra.AAC.1